MINLVLAILAVRPFLSEQVLPRWGILADVVSCVCCFVLMLAGKRKTVAPCAVVPLVFCAVAGGASFCTINIFNSQRQCSTYAVLALIFFSVTLLSRQQRRMLLNMMIAVSVLISLRAVYQFFIGLSYIAAHFSSQEITRSGFYTLEMLRQKRVISWFVSPNVLGSYLALMLCVSAGYLLEAIKEKARAKILFVSGVVLLLGGAFVATKSIGAYVGACAGIFVVLYRFFVPAKQGLVTAARWGCVAVCCGIVLMAMGQGRKQYFFNGNNADNSVTQRLSYWKSAVQMIREHPVCGVGAGNFGIAFPQVKEAQAHETMFAHNSYLQIGAESGVPALACFVVFIGCIVRAQGRAPDMTLIGLGAGSAAFLVHNLFDYSFFVVQAAQVWWIITALFLAEEDSGHQVVIGKRMKWCCGFLLLSVLCFLLMEYAAENNLKKAESFYEEKQYARAIAFAQESLRYSPANDSAYYVVARLLRAQQDEVFSPDVVRRYAQAIAFNPQYSFYAFELGTYLLKFGKPEKAEYFYRRACQLYPTNERFHRVLEKVSFRPK